MGSDELFKKRRAKTAEAMQRRLQRRSSQARFLIVCEGQKTEPNYFKELRSAHRLRTTQVTVAPSQQGSSPNQVLAYAQRLYQEEKRNGDTFDRVYCVIDRDEHSSYAATVDAISTLAQKGVPIECIASVPCFEFWLLLHWVDSSRPFRASGKRSACDRVIGELKKHLKSYSKAQPGIYHRLRDRTETAIKRAEKILRDAKQLAAPNPSTQVHRLVQTLLLQANAQRKAR